MNRFKVNDDKTICEVYRMSRAKNVPDILLGIVTIKADGEIEKEIVTDLGGFPLYDALVQLGIMTQIEADIKALGF